MATYRQSLEDRVLKSKDDKDKISVLISQFKPFIASVAQKRVGRYLQYGTDDELSVGLIAFSEAVNSFDRKRGKFLGFARMVINARLIDHFRKQERATGSGSTEDGDAEDALDIRSMEQYGLDSEEEDRKAEVIEYTQKLKSWGISFEELVRISPKKDDLRVYYKKAARVIVDNKAILDSLLETKRLPIKEIGEIMELHRKKLERGRIYIIAMVLALLGDFSYLDICRGDS
jgi:RNA polymerase sigma factor